MTQSHQRELEKRLETLSCGGASENREQILAAIQAFVPADFGMHMRFVRDGHLKYSFPAMRGQDELVNVTCNLRGSRVRDVPWLPPNADPGELDTFIRPRAYYGDKRYFSTRAYREVYERLEIRSELRALVTDHDEFTGWFGLHRRGRGNRFSQAERELLSAVMPRLKTALVSLDAIDRKLQERDIAAVFQPDGSLDHASRAFVEWADTDRLAYVRRRIRDTDAGKDRAGIEHLETAEVRVIRLDAGFDTADGVRYMVTVDRAELWTLRPEHRLTERQLEVADFARVGATAREIADTLDISKNTVKQHLKNIYRRLGIGSRAELADVMGR
jgi:DNA-binding CsgD family transcriptional regulator